MTRTVKKPGKLLTVLFTGLVVAVLAGVFISSAARAAAPPAENPQSGSVGLQGVVPSKPPSQGATIITPSSGQSFTKTPISVNGLCPKGLLVKLFANNVFVGSTMCVNGSYSLQTDLFDGRNDLAARVFDALDQPGPDSNVVTVTFTNNQFRNTGIPILSLTSTYARRGANPGQLLTWPIIISGGNGPYAVSIDWGDTKPPTLVSLPFAGAFDGTHTYDSSGVYSIVVKATDSTGASAYLQLVGEANGAVTQSGASNNQEGGGAQTKVQVLWLPAALAVPLIALSFWLGRRYELSSLRRHLESIR